VRQVDLHLLVWSSTAGQKSPPRGLHLTGRFGFVWFGLGPRLNTCPSVPWHLYCFRALGQQWRRLKAFYPANRSVVFGGPSTTIHVHPFGMRLILWLCRTRGKGGKRRKDAARRTNCELRREEDPAQVLKALPKTCAAYAKVLCLNPGYQRALVVHCQKYACIGHRKIKIVSVFFLLKLFSIFFPINKFHFLVTFTKMKKWIKLND